MNVEKFYALIEGLLEDYQETDIDNLLGTLSEHLQNQVDDPTQSSHQKGVADTLTLIQENLKNAPSNNFHEDWKRMMASLDIEDISGQLLLEIINDIFLKNQITPVLALEKIENFHEEIKAIYSDFSNIQKAFEILGIDRDSLKEGQCEISITFPKNYSNLDKLSKELGHLNKDVLRPFIEAVGERPDGFAIRSVSSSDPTFYLEAIPKIAFSIMLAVKLALSIYKDILVLKIKRQELKNIEVEKNVLDVFDKYIEKKIKTLSEKYMQEYFKELIKIKLTHSNTQSSGRSKEEEGNQIAKSIAKLVKRFDEGFSINVQGKPHTAKESKNDDGQIEKLSDTKKVENKLIEKIQESTKALMYRNINGPQIPELLRHLDDSHSDGDDSEGAEK